jgi:hypothetical protein
MRYVQYGMFSGLFILAASFALTHVFY